MKFLFIPMLAISLGTCNGATENTEQVAKAVCAAYEHCTTLSDYNEEGCIEVSATEFTASLKSCKYDREKAMECRDQMNAFPECVSYHGQTMVPKVPDSCNQVFTNCK